MKVTITIEDEGNDEVTYRIIHSKCKPSERKTSAAWLSAMDIVKYVGLVDEIKSCSVKADGKEIYPKENA